MGMVAFAQSSVDALGNSSDAAQRVFDGTVQQPTDSTWDVSALQVMPEFPGGMNGMIEYLISAIKYPEEELDAGIQGTVYVRFIVDKKGAVRDVTVIRGVNPNLDAEAVRAVKAMPNWSPGMKDGKPVKVRFTLPVSFKLEEPVPAKD